jgi:DNA-binding transcriptional LysR family regulator
LSETAQESLLAAARNIYFDGDGFAFEAALEGVGITLGRRTLVTGEIQDNRLVVALPGEERLLDSYYFVYFPQRPKAKAFRAFRKWIGHEALKADQLQAPSAGSNLPVKE